MAIKTNIGGGGVSDDTLNLCPNSGAEDGLAGWSNFTTDGTNPLVLGAYTGGAGDVELTQESTNVITGSSSYRMTSTGALASNSGFHGHKISLDPLPAVHVGVPVVVSVRVRLGSTQVANVLMGLRDNTNGRMMRQYGAHRASAQFLPGDNTSRGIVHTCRQDCTINALFYGASDVNDYSDVDFFIALAQTFDSDTSGNVILDEIRVTPLSQYDGIISFAGDSGSFQWVLDSVVNDNNTSWLSSAGTRSHCPIEPGGMFQMSVLWQISATGTLTLPGTNGGFFSSMDCVTANANLQLGGNSSWNGSDILEDADHFQRGSFSMSSGSNHQFHQTFTINPNVTRINTPLLSLNVSGSFSVTSLMRMLVYGGRLANSANFKTSVDT